MEKEIKEAIEKMKEEMLDIEIENQIKIMESMDRCLEKIEKILEGEKIDDKNIDFFIRTISW